MEKSHLDFRLGLTSFTEASIGEANGTFLMNSHPWMAPNLVFSQFAPTSQPFHWKLNKYSQKVKQANYLPSSFDQSHSTWNENIDYSNHILIRFQVVAALAVKLILYDPWFSLKSSISAGIARKMSVLWCRLSNPGGSLGMVQLFAGKLPMVHWPSQSGRINFLKHKCGHKMNKDMAVDAKVPDYMENMLQLEVK